MSAVVIAAALVLIALAWRRVVAEMEARREWAAKRQFENAKNATSPRSLP